MKILPFLLLALLTACVGIHEPIKTERVSLPGKSIAEARSAAVSYLVGSGWTPKLTDPLMLQFEKEANFSAQFLLQEGGSQTVRDRLTLTFLESSAGLELIGHLVLVNTRFGNQQEQSTDQTNARGRYLVTCVRASILGEPIPAPPISTNSPAVSTRGNPHGRGAK